MLSNILVASDGSEASGGMIECVRDLSRIGSRRATLVHVFNVRDVGGLYGYLQRFMIPVLETQAASLQDAGFEVDIHTPLGIPFVEINRLAIEKACTLVVVGSLGASLTEEMLLGSTAHAVLHNAAMPILLVRLRITQENGGKRCLAACHDLFAHILFPTDFSDTAEHALLYLEHVVRNTSAHVTLLHVQDATKIERHLKHRLDEFNMIDAERMEGIKLRLERCGAATVAMEIPYGSPTAHILNRAANGPFSLILMGSQGRGFVQEVFLGSVANNVARHAPLPVLFVPAIR